MSHRRTRQRYQFLGSLSLVKFSYGFACESGYPLRTRFKLRTTAALNYVFNYERGPDKKRQHHEAT